MTWMQYEIFQSSLYFFVGLLIAGTSRFKPWLYAIIPAIIIRGTEMIKFGVMVKINRYGESGAFPYLYVITIILYAVLFSFAGTVVGALASKPRTFLSQSLLNRFKSQ